MVSQILRGVGIRAQQRQHFESDAPDGLSHRESHISREGRDLVSDLVCDVAAPRETT